MKLIIVTWWVLSWLGKGITWASIWAILKAAWYKIRMQKLDGYLNVDPGTMNPVEHGEVFVMDDGFETDLDLGHYERFIDTNLTRESSYTTGRIYEEIISAERAGEYLGQTVQIIPHVTDKVKSKIRNWYEQAGADIWIIEIWGTIGDIENEYLVEAARQLRQELGHESVQFVHLTYVPYLAASKELKTKPTQNSVKDLMRRGIHPDLLVVRADTDISEQILTKIAAMTGIEHIIPGPTIETIYQIPLDYHAHHVGHHLLDNLWLGYTSFDMSAWQTLHSNFKNSTTLVQIAMVGKYVDLEDAYYSLNEALKVAWWMNERKVVLNFVDAEQITDENAEESLSIYDGICVPGGFGTRGVEGMIQTARYAREHHVPYLGICLWSQIMAIEFARYVLGIEWAASAEFDDDFIWGDVTIQREDIIHLMHDQKDVQNKWWTMRLWSYPCVLDRASYIWKIYEKWGRDGDVKTDGDRIYTTERHRHRYEFNNIYREQFEEAGFHIAATSPDEQLVEMVELRDHPCMIATQAHPELTSRPTYVHPLLMGWVSKVVNICNSQS